MSIEQIADQVHKLGNAWEEFKKVNDSRLAEIEKKGSADTLYTGQLDKINAALDEQKGRLDQLQTAMNRAPAGDGAKENKDEKHNAAFRDFIRKGIISPEIAPNHFIEGKALSVQSDPDGGYLVSPEVSSKINKVIFETSPMRELASVQTISSDSLEIMDDVNSATAGWTSEIGAVNETNTPQIGKRSITVHEMYAQPKATQKLLDDASVDAEAWLAAKVADVMARLQNTAFISGSGVAQPRGILSYTAGTSWGQIQQINSGSSGAVTADSLINLLYSLKSDYAKNATFLMNRSVVASVRLLKDSTNQYLWQPSMQAGQPDSLLAQPVVMASDMPVASANSLSIALADFKTAYQIVDRQGITMLRDPFTDKPYVKFYSRTRVGGDVINFEAIKLLKLAA